MTHHSSTQPEADPLTDLGIGLWQWDPTAGTVHWDPTTESLYGLEPGTFGGTFDEYLTLIHPEDVNDVVDLIEKLGVRGGNYSIRHRVVWPDGTVKWIEGQGTIRVDADGNPAWGRGIVYGLGDRLVFDGERSALVERELSARTDSIESRERLRFLIEIGDALAGSLNTERVARQLSSLIVKRLADVCVIDVQLQDPHQWIMTCVGSASGAQVVETGSPTMLPAAATRINTAGSPHSETTTIAGDTAAQAALLPTTAASTCVVPLVAHGTEIGTVIGIRHDRDWSADSIELMEAAAMRAAVALDRAELYADRSKFAAMFRVSATPRDLPDIPGLDLALHYRPATDLVRLGGDLYDVFQIGDGAWFAVVGDICGKGITAAADAQYARSALRAAATATGDPIEALRVVNRVLLDEDTRPMLTAVIARIDLSTGPCQIRLAAAGHPHPLLITGTNEWDTIEVPGTMLGVHGKADFVAADLSLSSGQSLALYTDGITESRFGGTFFGTERLGTTIAAAWPAPARALASSVGTAVEAWSNGQPNDDVLLMLIEAAAGESPIAPQL